MRPCAVVVFIDTPCGIILVINPTEKSLESGEAYYKLPGGRSERWETRPSQVGTREVFEETGLRLKEEDLEEVYCEPYAEHDWYVFRAQLSYIPTLRTGNEGEIGSFWLHDELVKFQEESQGVLRSHWEVMKSLLQQGVLA